MTLLTDAIAWIFASEQWSGDGSLLILLLEQLWLTAVGVVAAAIIAVPAGWLIGHTGRGREIAVGLTGAARAIPSFGLLLLLVLLFGVLHKPEAAIVTFVILAVPSLLAGAYAGLEAIDRQTVGAARAVGMSEWQIFFRVELPLGLPLLIGGIRSATLQVVATVTIAAYVNLGGLGMPIITGLALRRYDMVLGAAILVALLALAIDGVLAITQRFATPRGVRAGRGTVRRKRRRPAASARQHTSA